MRATKRTTKKAQIIQLYPEIPDVEALARALDTSPSYVANTLIDAGYTVSYSDVFTTSRAPVSSYARLFAGVLKFKDEAAAHQSIARIDSLYRHFAETNDFRGMYQAQQLALLGKLRARALGKFTISRLFADWLAAN